MTGSVKYQKDLSSEKETVAIIIKNDYKSQNILMEDNLDKNRKACLDALGTITMSWIFLSREEKAVLHYWILWKQIVTFFPSIYTSVLQLELHEEAFTLFVLHFYFSGRLPWKIYQPQYLVQLKKYSKDRSITCFLIEFVKSLLLSRCNWKQPGKWKNRPTSKNQKQLQKSQKGLWT